FNEPRPSGIPFFGASVALDSAGNLWVSDTGNERVLSFSQPFGFHQTNSTSADVTITDFGGFEDPAPPGITLDYSGNFFLALEHANRIVEFNSGGTSPNFSIGPGAGNFPNATTLEFPMGLALDAVGNLYAADLNGNRVIEYQNPVSRGSGKAGRVLGQ